MLAALLGRDRDSLRLPGGLFGGAGEVAGGAGHLAGGLGELPGNGLHVPHEGLGQLLATPELLAVRFLASGIGGADGVRLQQLGPQGFEAGGEFPDLVAPVGAGHGSGQFTAPDPAHGADTCHAAA